MSTVPDAPAMTLHEHDFFSGAPVFGRIYTHNGSNTPPHNHDFLEVAVIGDGVGSHVTSGGVRPLSHGSVLIVRPGAWHGFADDCEDLTVANCGISASALRGELSWLREIPSLGELLWRDPLAMGKHGVLLTQIPPAEADQAIEEIGQLARDLTAPLRHADRALGRMLTVLGTIADARREDAERPGAIMHPAVAAAVAKLEEAPAYPWTLEDLARTVNLAPVYLGRLFRRDVGLTPITLLAKIRAERAASLLTQTTLPTARVGAAVGWHDPPYFARRFRSLTGLTPSEHRLRNQNIANGSNGSNSSNGDASNGAGHGMPRGA